MTHPALANWNERYASAEFAYGKGPNVFFAEQLQKLEPANILLPAEGEGRNAVYAATQGWHVTAFDMSEEGRKKAAQLAREAQTSIMYELNTFEAFTAPPNFFSCIGFIYSHMHSSIRRIQHQRLATFLKPGGSVILECFSKNQLLENHPSGGPKDPEWLYSVEDLQEDFKDFKHLDVREERIQLNEGEYHQGSAAVIRVYGIK